MITLQVHTALTSIFWYDPYHMICKYIVWHAILHDMIRYSVASHEKTWYDKLPDTVQLFSLANIIRLWHWPEHCVAITLRAHLCTKMINYEYNGQPNLVCVSLKETIAELISTSDVSVTIHHFDLIVEETATFLIISNWMEFSIVISLVNKQSVSWRLLLRMYNNIKLNPYLYL